MVTAAALVYRLLYGGLLSRVPEASAVRIEKISEPVGA